MNSEQISTAHKALKWIETLELRNGGYTAPPTAHISITGKVEVRFHQFNTEEQAGLIARLGEPDSAGWATTAAWVEWDKVAPYKIVLFTDLGIAQQYEAVTA